MGIITVSVFSQEEIEAQGRQMACPNHIFSRRWELGFIPSMFHSGVLVLSHKYYAASPPCHCFLLSWIQGWGMRESPVMKWLMNTCCRRSRAICCCLLRFCWNISICLTCCRWSRCLSSNICWLCLWISCSLCASIFAASAFLCASEEERKWQSSLGLKSLFLLLPTLIIATTS